MAYCAGLTPEQFNDCTMIEVLLMIQGYRVRVRDMQYFHYQLATVSENQIPIYDFWPLPGDPTEAEKEQMKRDEVKEMERLYNEGQKRGQEWIKQYQKKGMLN